MYCGKYTKLGNLELRKFSLKYGGILVLYYPSLTNLDFFPILHFIGQSPDIGRQTQG